MKVFILTTVMAPYRVKLFSEIGKYCELYVCFEQMRSSVRNEKWYDRSSCNFNFVELKRRDASVKRVKHDVIKAVRRICPDVVIAYEYHTNTSLLLLSYCLTKKIPYIVNVDGAFVSAGIKDIVKHFYISRASGYISSGKMADQYLLHYGAKEKCIYHNHFTSLYDRDILSSAPSKEEKMAIREKTGITENKVVLSVGQFVHRKGYDILLKAAAAFNYEVGIYIIGGKATPEYIQTVSDLQLSNVHFMDFMSPDELKNYFAAADVFVLPTREDVWGLVINEAMAHGLPIVTTERCVSGIELIKNGVNGYIVPIENPERLYEAMDIILSDDAAKCKMASENLQVIRKYTYEMSSRDITRAIGEVYNTAAERK